MAEHFQEFVAWTSAHPNWALVILFLTAMLDAVFIIGALVPAAIVLFGTGALVPLGALDFWPVIAVAAAGALCGDGLSFWLGRHYGERLFEWRVLRRYPEVISNGRRFFTRHGGKSVMLARFLGPVRAITPAIAGATGMKPWLFILADGAAALPWALLYIAPGVVFGASLGLASEVAGRLATLLLTLVVALLLALWLTKLIFGFVQRHAERWLGGLLDWSRRHRRLGKFGAALADADQPETPVLAALAILLLLISAGVLLLLSGPQPLPVDVAVYQALRELHTPWSLGLARGLLAWGQWPVYGAVALAAIAALALRRHPRAAAHVLAALGFGIVITLGLDLIRTLPPPHELLGGIDPGPSAARDQVLSTITYALVPVLLARRRSARQAVLFYGAAVTVVLLLTSAQLYTGAQWFSLTVFSLSVGVLWATVLGVGYRRHKPERISRRAFLIPVLGVFLLASSLAWRGSEGRSGPAEGAELKTLSAQTWWARSWQELPARRLDMQGKDRQFLNLQWAGELPAIEQSLLASGWLQPQPLSFGSSLRWLSASTPVGELPLLPRFHAGNHQVLTLRKDLDEQRQYLLRLWPSGYALDTQTPLWIGTLVVQDARTVARLFRYPINENVYTVALDQLDLPLRGWEARREQRSTGSFTTLLLRPLH